MKTKGMWYKGIFSMMFVFLIIVFAIYKTQQNVTYEHQERVLEMVETTTLSAAPRLEQRAKCLLLWDEEGGAQMGRETMEDVLEQMKIPYESRESVYGASYDFTQYDSVVLSLSDVIGMGEGLMDLMEWTAAGGKLMLLFIPWGGDAFGAVERKCGILETSNESCLVTGLHFLQPLMLGCETRDFPFIDSYRSSLQVLLDSESQVYMESIDKDRIPLIWRRAYGEGTIVVMNLGYFGKHLRGIYCAAYSLLGDAVAWPVINASSFYLDDFPSPVPYGDNEFIDRDYHMSIDDFFRRVWWPDVQTLAEKYGIRFTGMVIEDYSDKVSGELPPSQNFTRYQYFGNMLLSMGGEIGFHGYNHMPLVLSNFDFHGGYKGYKYWDSLETMRASIAELKRFCENLYPQEQFQVYVPPSNVLSDEGRAMLAADFPNIKAVASMYMEDDTAYVQEFEVADDGVVETPRIISGCELNDYTRMAGLAELTMHYVNTHFMHPDDTLDVDRGAELGWAEMYARLTDYADWLYMAAPNIRNLTGSELAAAVQRYDALQVEQRIEGETLKIELGGFVDEAYLLVRLNGKTPGEVSGGELSQLMDSLYLLRADEANVAVALNGRIPEAVE